MRRALWLLAALLCGCGRASVAVKRGYDFKNIRRVAILGFPDYERQPGSGDSVASVFENYLLKAGYDVVERREVDKLLREQSFSMSGAVDPRKAKELGKLLGIDALVLGNITEFVPSKNQIVQTGAVVEQPYLHRRRRYYSSGAYVAAPAPTTLDSYAKVGIAARMVEVETGSVLWIGSDSEEDSTIQESADEASEAIMKAVKSTWPIALLK